MITFETEEDFEDAVMAVLTKRLEISVDIRNASWYDSDGKVIEVTISDNVEGWLCESSASLPTLALQY